MLRFVDITEDLSYLERSGIPWNIFGIQFSPNDKPLDFQYISSEAIASFTANKINLQGNIIETIILNTSLVTLSSGMHICTGQINFAANLEGGLYYFSINDRYNSELFQVTYEVLPNYLELESGGFLDLESGGYLELIN